MKIFKTAVFALFMVSTAVHAQSTLSPASFVAQIEQNVQRIEGWAKDHVRRDSSVLKMRAYTPTAKNIDVVRSDSVLRPYIGKLHFFVSFAYGGSYATLAEARAAPFVYQQGNINTHECNIEFVPTATAWQVSRLNCRSTLLMEWADMDLAEYAGTPMHDMMKILEIPAPPARPAKTARPAKPRT